jgi:hypothetical protein
MNYRGRTFSEVRRAHPKVVGPLGVGTAWTVRPGQATPSLRAYSMSGKERFSTARAVAVEEGRSRRAAAAAAGLDLRLGVLIARREGAIVDGWMWVGRVMMR